MNRRIVLLDSYTADQGCDLWPGLDELGTVSIHPRVQSEQLDELCAGADALITNKVVIGADLMQRLQPRLRYVGVSATGVNIVDVEAARALGIAVTNVPAYSTASVAQLTIGLLLQLSLDLAGHSNAAKAGRWAAGPDFSFTLRPLIEWQGKRLLLVGKGAIGSAVAAIAEAMGLKVEAAQVPGSATKQGRVALAEALPRADVVSLHCPLTPQTDKLVNSTFLSSMKPGAILLNTGRGGLVDEAALVEALEQGHLGGVGLDVLSQEPPQADMPLLSPQAPWADRVLVTPHIAWGSVEARRRLREEVSKNLAAFFAGEKRNRVD